MTPEITHQTPPDVAAGVFAAATSRLNGSEKGSTALRALASICDDLVSLDASNQQAVLVLVRGIFSHPGTGRDVLKEAAGIT